MDYVLLNTESLESVTRFEVGHRTEADHQPLGLYLKSKARKECRRKEKKRRIQVEHKKHKQI